MLEILLLNQVRDFYKYERIVSGAKVTVLSPTLEIADQVRMHSLETRPDLELESANIFKFVLDRARDLNPEVNFYSNSRLIVELYSVWKRYFPAGTNELFRQAFNHFIYLREFTVAYDLVSEVLVNFSNDIAKGIGTFWHYLDEQNIIDEASLYSLVAKYYGDSECEFIEQSYIFHNFSHMSAYQVDLVKAMAQENSIYVPVCSRVYDQLSSSDWISWLGVEDLSHKGQDIVSDKGKLNLINSEQGCLGETLQSFLNTQSSNKKTDLVLLQQKVNFFEVQEIIVGESFFRAQVSIFKDAYTSVSEEVKNKLDVSGEVASPEVLGWLEQIIAREQEKGFSHQDFRKIKVARLLREGIFGWSNLSEMNDKFTGDDYDILFSSLEVDLPSGAVSAVTNETAQYTIHGIPSIGTLIGKSGGDNRIIVCVSSASQDMDSAEESICLEVDEFLRSVGPIKRKELEVAILREEILAVLSMPDSHLLIEGDVLETSSFWRELKSVFDIQNEINPEVLTVKRLDYVGGLAKSKYTHKKKWSAARLQSYIDCPRSFYYQYVDKFYLDVSDSKTIEARILGELEHKTIEEYLNKYDSFSADKHELLVGKLLDDCLREKGMAVGELEYSRAKVEIATFSANGIDFLLRFKERHPDTKFSFEVKFEDEQHSGRVDCILEHDDGISIIDFKRSSGSIPGANGFNNFKKIQLWYYALGMKGSDKVIQSLSYLNLSNPKESRAIILDDGDVGIKLENYFASLGMKGVGKNTPSSLSDFEAHLGDTIDSIVGDNTFAPRPIDSTTCKYCWLKNICTGSRA